MKKSLLKLLGVAAITWSAQASAAGIGGINVVSALGQPLKADIELFSVDKTEKSSLVARLASPEAYKQVGLSYPYGNSFKFIIESRADGASYIHATSSKEINDPFVSLLVELSWASGKLVREYTFLLDPVGYQAEQPAAAPVQAVAPAVAPAVTIPPAAVAIPEQQLLVPVPAIASEPVESKPIESKPIESKPLKQTVKPTPTVKSSKVAPVKQAAQSSAAVNHEVKVLRGDNLSKIAAENSVNGVSLERMLVAMYRANADQFEAKNMNRINAGKILRLPSASELEAVSQPEAWKVIRAQVNDWNAYRQKMASSAALSAEHQEAQQVSAGKIRSSVADKAPVAKADAKEVLKLSKGDAVNDKVAASGKTVSQDHKNAAQEDAIAMSKAAVEARNRTELLERNVEDMTRLVELKSEAAALAQGASAPSAASDVAATSAVEAASAVPLVAKPKPAIPEPSLLDDVLANPLYLGGGAAALLGLGGLAFAMARRKRKPTVVAATTVKEEDFGATTGRITAPITPSPDTGDFTVQAGSTQTLETASGNDDPVSEADLFLSFGRDVQAEEILKEALHTSANKTAIRLKLLEIYVTRKDAKSFEGIATQLKSGSDAQTWSQIADMGRKLDPQNTLYGGNAKVEDSDSATMQTVALSAPVDLTTKTLTRGANSDTLATEATPAAAKTATFTSDELVDAKSTVMDFDVTATNPSMPAPPITMDFDVTATHEKLGAMAGQEESLPNLEDLVFDVTATHPKLPAMHEDVAASTKQPAVQQSEADMPFTLDFPVEIPAAKETLEATPVEFDLANINLNMDDPLPVAETKIDSVLWHEVATKLDLAKAYQEMGDDSGAKEILEEVLKEGDAEQRASAQDILNQLG